MSHREHRAAEALIACFSFRGADFDMSAADHRSGRVRRREAKRTTARARRRLNSAICHNHEEH